MLKPRTKASEEAAELEALALRFKRFAEAECHGSSPLYEHLSFSIAADEEMLALASYCAKGQPVPNLFLGAVHYLLLRGVTSPLSAFYPSLSSVAGSPEAAYPHFRAFCLSHREEIISIVSTRLVQTNEIRRCSYLLPAFSFIAAVARRPLALVEVGTSAGLNLLWDRYGYRYKHGSRILRAGDAASPVQIVSCLRGDNPPNLPAVLPQVSYRLGLDLNIVDLNDKDEALWLRALIWPEHEERVYLLKSALPIIQAAQPKLISGDAVALLPGAIKDVPAEAALVIFHTHTVNQFPSEARERLSAVIHEEAMRRDVFRLANDLGRGGALKLITFENGEPLESDLANVDGHGRWVEWLANEEMKAAS